MHSLSFDNAVRICAAQTPAPRPWRKAALGAFLGLSALGHALLLMLPVHQPDTPSVRSAGTLQVRMESVRRAPAPGTVAHTEAVEPPPAPAAPRHPAETAAKAAPKPTRTERAPAHTTTAAAPEAEPAPAAATSSAPQPQRTPSAARAPAAPEPNGPAVRPETAAPSVAAAQPAPAAPGPDPATITERLRTRLQQSLRSYFHYPRLARHRGWEGRVEVGLRVEADGNLSDIRIVRTSGFAVLDRAALASVGRIRRLPDASFWLGGRHIDMVLPVQYRLIDG